MMRKMIWFILIALLLAGASLLACSDDKDSGSQKGKIETFTHETAQKAVKKMRSPIDKARAVKDLSDKRTLDMEKNIEE